MSDTHCEKCGMEWTLPHEIWRAGPNIKPCTCGANHADGIKNERTAHAQGRHRYRAYTRTQAVERG